MSCQSKVAVKRWVPGEMSAPRYDFPTLLMAGSQVLLDEQWMTVRGMLPCATGAHGAMCAMVPVGNGWGDWATAHVRLDEQAWIRHQIEAAEVGEVGDG